MSHGEVNSDNVAEVIAAFQKTREELAEARALIEIQSKNLDERDRVLRALECPVHGSCVPGALERIQVMLGYREALKMIAAELHYHGPYATHKQDGCWGCVLVNIARLALEAK